MKSDKAIILDSTCVPQQMLVLTCVLRYILGTEKKVLRKSELEAYIAQAFIQDMTDPTIAQDIEVSTASSRKLQLTELILKQHVNLGDKLDNARNPLVPHVHGRCRNGSVGQRCVWCTDSVHAFLSLAIFQRESI